MILLPIKIFMWYAVRWINRIMSYTEFLGHLARLENSLILKGNSRVSTSWALIKDHENPMAIDRDCIGNRVILTLCAPPPPPPGF